MEQRRPNVRSLQRYELDLLIRGQAHPQIKLCQFHPDICEPLPASSELAMADMNRHKFVRVGEKELRQLLHHDFQKVRCDGYMAPAKARAPGRSMLQAERARVVELNP